jgi:uncharacterized damage-inducible protein DinB
MSTDISIIASTLKSNTQLFEKATQGIPAEKWLARPSDDSNHLLWIAGHVVVHRALIPKLLGGEWSAPWEKLFARGEKLAAAEHLPPVDEIVRAWAEVSDLLTASLTSAAADVAAQPLTKKLPSFDGTVGGSMAFLSFHETYHLGQMSYLRKWLGYGQVIG